MNLLTRRALCIGLAVMAASTMVVTQVSASVGSASAPQLTIGPDSSILSEFIPASPETPTTLPPAADTNTVTTISEQEQNGIGSPGTLTPYPLCAINTAVDVDTETCVPTATPIPMNTRQLLPTTPCAYGPDQDFEDLFTEPAQMEALLQCWVVEADYWIDVVVTGMQHPNGYLYIPTGATGNIGDVGGCEFSDQVLLYCLLDQRVYFGEQFVWELYNVGDAVIPHAVAHEIAHHFQHQAQMPIAARPFEVIPGENQADCVGGVFLDYLAAYGGMDPTGDDVVDLAQGLITFGEAEGEERTHGTIDQRMRAFYTGYLGNNGLFPCNQYVPTWPIITPV